MRRGRPRRRPPNPYAATPFATWDQLSSAVPDIADVMVRYVEQVTCILRPGSVVGTDLDLRCFAIYLTECHPDVRTIAAVARPQIEGYKPWLAARPGQNKPNLTPATIAHRLGVLRMFFVRIESGPDPLIHDSSCSTGMRSGLSGPSNENTQMNRGHRYYYATSSGR